MAYYYYKLTTDNGGAPCVSPNLLSLAICKPQIRSTAKSNDWIFGFGGRSALGERLIYIAEVTDKLENGDYYREARYADRPDHIYEWVNDALQWKPGSRFHEGGQESDIGPPPHSKAKVLLSNNYRYFGAAGTDEYKKAYPAVGKAVAALGMGHRVNHPPELESELTQLREDIWRRLSTARIGQPSHGDFRRPCNQSEGDVECGSASVRELYLELKI